MAGLLGCPSEVTTLYPYAFGAAMEQLRDLIAIAGQLAPAQVTP